MQPSTARRPRGSARRRVRGRTLVGMHSTSEPVERADQPSPDSSFTVLIPATGSRIRIRRIGTQLREQTAR